MCDVCALCMSSRLGELVAVIGSSRPVIEPCVAKIFGGPCAWADIVIDRLRAHGILDVRCGVNVCSREGISRFMHSRHVLCWANSGVYVGIYLGVHWGGNFHHMLNVLWGFRPLWIAPAMPDASHVVERRSSAHMACRCGGLSMDLSRERMRSKTSCVLRFRCSGAWHIRYWLCAACSSERSSC